ncbi:MAG: hypothetical protein ABSC72_12155 [Methylovirgula sp.]|jgi:hypothetical protein
MRAIIGFAVLAVLAKTPCQANPLDDCTLKNMAGVTSDAAAKFVRQACLGRISSAIAPEHLSIQATAAMGSGQFDDSNQLYVTVQNNSPYAITEMMIRVATEMGTKWNDYEATNFLQIPKPGVIMTGLPPDPATYLQIKPFSAVTFCIAIREPNLPQGKWSWQVLSAKGYLAAE